MSDLELVLCRLTKKRVEILDEDPELVIELLEARHDDIPGLVLVGTAWDALSRIVGEHASPAFTGEGGRAVAEDAFIFPPRRVAELAKLLPSADVVISRAPQLVRAKLHGGYLATAPMPGDDKRTANKKARRWKDDIDDLQRQLERTRKLYSEASAAGEAMLVGRAAA